ncbi:hypothetical protein [Rhodopseudomonas palustris]|uniref:hypothetical protein n=1 Tax=Rhodopseudomonas palustris TaxID=1076 RepID=UPI0021F3139F|nr:hypothetical protein [Rhodopseudomonas palustris]UYO52051.1 hypothetical protein KQX61_15680 [Rhodopseudomonas palustris]
MVYEQMLYDCAQNAAVRFARIARTFEPPPESFLVSSCMIDIFEQNPDWCLRPELPSRECSDWGIPKDDPASPLLGSFRIDLACFRSSKRTAADATLLVEFKLWTNRYDVERDLARLRALTSAISGVSRSHPLEAYVICCPHYETLQRVEDAIEYFATIFKFQRRPAFLTTDGGSKASAGIVVLNALDCAVS